MTDHPQPLDLDAIEARANNATPGPWEPKPHQHGAVGCRCLSCNEDPTGWYVDNSGTTFCDDVVAKLSAAGKTNDFGRELDSCDEGPFLTYADAEFITRARTDVPALVAEIRRLTAELQQARKLHAEVPLHLYAEDCPHPKPADDQPDEGAEWDDRHPTAMGSGGYTGDRICLDSPIGRSVCGECLDPDCPEDPASWPCATATALGLTPAGPSGA